MKIDLNGKRVLVVEDNYLIAGEIADLLRKANANVIGPCATVGDGTAHASQCDVAVLDVDLGGRMVFPLADRLIDLDVPYIFLTGFEPDLLPRRFSHVECIAKPFSPLQAIQRLVSPAQPEDASSVDQLIPILRLQARRILVDIPAADRLVEMTLLRAIERADAMPTAKEVGAWLAEIMRGLITESRRHYFN
jgi:CheY-like chemotaxis protein